MTTMTTPELDLKSLEGQGVRLAVQYRGGGQLGRCYSETLWTIYSRWINLPNDVLKTLIPHGQEFHVGERVQNSQGWFIIQVREATDSSD